MAARSGLVVVTAVVGAAVLGALILPGGTTFTTAYKCLRAPIFRIRRSGRKLILREPKYSATDANCCPSHYRDRTLRWTGSRFKATVKIRRA